MLSLAMSTIIILISKPFKIVFRNILAELDEDVIEKLTVNNTVQAEKSQMRELNLTTWYHEGPEELIPAREFIAAYR